MNWFKGTIPEAIAAAKCSNGIFAVYIYDKTDLSKSTREKLNEEEVRQVLSSSKYVAIEIENGSNDAIQFAQIYPLIVVPSLFFISPQNGIPLEVIGGNFEVKTLLEKLQKIIPTANEPLSQPETKVNEHDPKFKDSSCKESDTQSSSEEPEIPEPSPSTASDEPAAETSSDPPSVTLAEEEQPSLEERVERAKDLLNQRQELKDVEDLEEENRKEIDRRRQSQELTKAKQKREEQERIDLGKQRRKEKEEDRLARERVKAQIAADRAERQARNSLLRGEQPPPPPPPPTQEAPSTTPVTPAENQNKNTVTRIKFRFPDNSSELAQFSPDATLNDVRTHLVEKSELPYSKFKLVATLPPRSFTDDQMHLTLADLGLTPSAIIIVKPLSASSSVSLVPSGKGVMAMFWSFISPLTFLINYLKGFLGFGRKQEGSHDSSDEEESQTTKRPRTEGSYTTRNRPKTAYGRRGERDSFLRREGNIHRLNRPGDDDDDDENNTWNGNSTQQM